jgi:hypothetical protein
MGASIDGLDQPKKTFKYSLRLLEIRFGKEPKSAGQYHSPLLTFGTCNISKLGYEVTPN